MYVVTGAAGFIGANLVRGLNARGITDILLVDDLTDGAKHRNLDGLAYADYLDFRDFRSRLASFSRIDAVLHQGACSDTMQSDGRYMMDNNYQFSKELLAWAMALQAPFLYASSASVYGTGSKGFREELHCEQPLNVYAFSKASFDRWVRQELPRAQSPVVGLRYFNVYGPGEGHKARMASMVYHFHHQAARESRLKLFAGSEGFRRDFISVRDVVDVNLHFLDHPQQSGIFNCGTGQARAKSRKERAVAAKRPGTQIETVAFPAELRGKYQTFTEADTTRLRASGFSKPFTALEDGVADYLAALSRQETPHG